MIFEYCETCKKMTGGKFMTVNSMNINTYLCGVCNAITYLNYAGDEFTEIYEEDLKLRNEAIKLQLQYYKALNKVNIRRIQ